MKRNLFFLIFLLVLSLPAVLPIISPGYFPMHDDTQIVRIDQMYQALRQGQFPVRLVKDLGYGYGYPIFNFYNPFPYYFGALLMFLNIKAIIVTKITFIFPIILSGFTMFFLTKKYLSPTAGLLASLFYVYTPYHAVQVYVRGAVAEYWAYAFIPLLVAALLNHQLLLAGVTLALVVLSHNLTALMFVPIIGILFIIKLIFSKSKLDLISYYFAAALIGLSLSAFFWLPALMEKGITQLELILQNQSSPLEHFVFLRQLWTSEWGFGGSVKGINDGMSFMAGKLHLLLSAVSIPLLFLLKKTERKIFFFFCLSVLLISVYMSSSLSYPFWSRLKIFAYLQFPWRWLIFISLVLSILSGLSFDYFSRFAEKYFNRKLINFTGSLLLIGFVIYSTKFFKPQYKYLITETEALSREQVNWVVSQQSDEYLPKGFIVPKTKEEALGPKNPLNQTLIDEFAQPNAVRIISNYFSLISLVLVMLLAMLKLFNNYLKQRV